MLAVISDVHSNTAAMRAVLADMAERDIKQVVCLGDVVGYGPEPKECLDLTRGAATVALMGNHDYAVLLEPKKFNIGAEAACFWTRQQLEDETDLAKRNARWDFMGGLSIKHTMDGKELSMGKMTFVHGSPRRPINEYIFPDDVYNNPNKVQGLFDRFDHLCFVGHTHVPGVFLDTPDFYSPDELEGVFEIDDNRKAMINVGSVGQPRDRNNRASYVVVEPGLVRFVRVDYDVDTVVQKVLAVPELDDYLGLRLREGR
ncbi:MAG: metallophosphoesterase family protein [Planctomycetota bacterium]|nr:metallophosphoesterase family protein [Planctomycetota bacterium]